jgi:hypothetical protein
MPPACKRLLVGFALVVSPALLSAELDEHPPLSATRARNVGGTWRVFLPAGFEREVALKPLGDNRYEFEPANLTFSGVYEARGDRLVLVEPADSNRTGFEWHIRTRYLLTMTKQASNTGADYMGAILFRGKAEAEAANQ